MQVALIHRIAVEVLFPSHRLYQLITVGDDMEHKSRHKSAGTAARQDYVAGKKGQVFSGLASKSVFWSCYKHTSHNLPFQQIKHRIYSLH